MQQPTQINDFLSVAGQISKDDIAAIAQAGFAVIINNRPDGEQPGQPTNAEIEAAARGAGADYLFLPVVGRPTPEQAKTQAAAVAHELVARGFVSVRSHRDLGGHERVTEGQWP